MFKTYRIGVNAPESPWKPLTTAEANIRHGIGLARLHADIASDAIATGDWLSGSPPGMLGYYEIGLERGPGAAVGDLRFWEGVAWPEDIEERIDIMRMEILSFGRSMDAWVQAQGCTPVNKEGDCGRWNRWFQTVWTPFLEGWDRYRLGLKGWFSRAFAFNTMDELDEWQRRLIQMYDQARSIGIMSDSPRPSEPSGDRPGAFSALKEFLKWIAIAGLVGMGIWALVRVFQALAKLWSSRVGLGKTRVKLLEAKAKTRGVSLFPKRGPGRPKGS